jgi:hypothetical protein
VQRGLLVILLGAGGIGLTGCNRSEPPPAPRYTVQIDRLLPLHPLWTQVESLDSIGRRLDTTQPPVMAWEERPLPPAFPPPAPVPADLARERQRRIEADAQRYVQQLEDFLRDRMEETLARLDRAGRKAAEARFAGELARRIQEKEAENKRLADALLPEITRNEYREIALDTQIRIFKGQALEDARIQRNQVQSRLLVLRRQRTELLADVRPQVEKEMGPRRQAMLAEVDADIARRRKEEEKDIAKALTVARERLRAEAEAIPPLEQVAVPAPEPQDAPTAPAAPDPANLLPAKNTVAIVQTQRRREREAQRKRLVAAIQEDTYKAIAQISRQQGWQLVAPGTPRSADRTAAVADALRAQWKRN